MLSVILALIQVGHALYIEIERGGGGGRSIGIGGTCLPFHASNLFFAFQTISSPCRSLCPPFLHFTKYQKSEHVQKVHFVMMAADNKRVKAMHMIAHIIGNLT